MKKQTFIVAALAVYFLFLIQLAGSLVESIYILDLMNTSLDEKALGVLFFFTPLLLFLYRGQRPALTAWITFGFLFLARGLTPYLDTLGRMLTSGIGTGAALTLFPLLLTAGFKDLSSMLSSRAISAGFALGVSLSVLLRTAGFGLDTSLTPEGSWVGWLLGLALGLGINQLDWPAVEPEHVPNDSPTLAAAGIFLVIGLTWFAFSAPSVIARWTEGNYNLIVGAVSTLSLAWVVAVLAKPGVLKKVSSAWLLVWNLLFTLALTMTILAHRVSFPDTPEASAVLVGSPSWIQQLPLAISLLLFPVIYFDLSVFAGRIQASRPGVRDLLPGILLGSFSLVLLVFMQIFTNVWGYIEPVSPWFRNKFWLPYALMAGLLTLFVGLQYKPVEQDTPNLELRLFPTGVVLLALVWLGTLGIAFESSRVETIPPSAGSLKVMTYNIQQANDAFGERSFQEQLALIQKENPDILALQESDSARVSLNNSDYVRYYAGKLGYYSYFGPKTVTGTYGTAILSKYPLQNKRTIFSFSDQDEVGTAAAEVVIGGETFTVYNVHPAGSDTAMNAFAETILERSLGKDRVIILGDFNLRDYEGAYQLFASCYTNAWESVYPSKISPDGTDMSGENRIDHIFISPDLEARNPTYLLPPDSATDHPAHWADIIWEDD